MIQCNFGDFVRTGHGEGRIVAITREHYILLGLSGKEEVYRWDDADYVSVDRNEWDEENEQWWRNYCVSIPSFITDMVMTKVNKVEGENGFIFTCPEGHWEVIGDVFEEVLKEAERQYKHHYLLGSYGYL